MPIFDINCIKGSRWSFGEPFYGGWKRVTPIRATQRQSVLVSKLHRLPVLEDCKGAHGDLSPKLIDVVVNLNPLCRWPNLKREIETIVRWPIHYVLNLISNAYGYPALFVKKGFWSREALPA